jgi:hypothetical protein
VAGLSLGLGLPITDVMSITLRLWQPERWTLYTALASLPIIVVGAIDLALDPVNVGTAATVLVWVLLILASFAISFGVVGGIIGFHFRERSTREELAYFASLCGFFIALGLVILLAIVVRGPFARWAGLAIGVVMLLRSLGVPLAFRVWHRVTARRST